MGQADIHKKIMSLKFRDCHAKIRQVDSHPSVSNAVVVQVTGELSNAGQPMRRFMQTFVLAPQSPKKYYVHNDIFRYQDEVFHDLEGEGEAADESVDSEQEAADSAPENVQEHPSFYEQPAAAPLSNGNAAVAEEPVPVEEEKPQPPPLEEEVPAAEPEQEFESKYEEPVKEEEEEPAVPEVEPEQEQPPPPQQKPFSWAALASQKPQVGMQPAPTMNQAPKQAPPAAKPAAAKPGGGPDDKPLPQRQRPQRGERPARDNSRSGMSENDDPNRRSVGKMYPDTQQLFVGNLPHNIDERELQEFFTQYGKVMEVRINRKSSTQNRDVPNFGFVVFASEETVNDVLKQRPIHLRDDLRLNVEEKKHRGHDGNLGGPPRPGSGTRMGRGGGQGGMMGRGGGSNRGRGGQGGPPRSDRGGGGGGRGGGEGGGRGGFGRPR